MITQNENDMISNEQVHTAVYKRKILLRGRARSLKEYNRKYQ